MTGKRETEIKVLTEYANRSGSQLLILYGEKGVGKTTLLKEVAKNSPKSIRMLFILIVPLFPSVSNFICGEIKCPLY